MADRKVSWGPRDKHSLIGKPLPRIDGVEKASGFAKYTFDVNPEGTLYAKLLTCKMGKAKITRLDVEKAKKIPGVFAVYLFKQVGDVCNWDGEIVAAVAADRAQVAEDGVRAIEATFEAQPHFVDEDDLAGAQKFKETVEVDGKKEEVSRAKPLVDRVVGDPDAAIKNAAVVHTGYYGVTTISHMCLETHGSHAEWKTGEGPKLVVHHSTQNVSGTGGQFAQKFGLDAADVRIICNYIGGGFGSKFAADEWGWAAAQLAKDSGRPVRLMLDRATELKTPGTRPSGFAEVTLGADKDGKITVWKSHHWGTDGPQGGTIDGNQMPYVFDFENKDVKSTGITTNCGPNRAWRAPHHPQLCVVTDCAIDDLAAKLNMDPVDVFLKNIDQLDKVASDKAYNKADVYRAEIKRAAELIGWKKNWHTRGKGEGKTVKRGLGLAIHRWGGGAVKGTCNVKVHPDGGAEVFLGSQDLGTGTRTVIAQVLAETFGLALDKVKVNLGSNAYPPANPSGGSITVGSVTGSTRRAAQALLWKISDLVAEKYKVAADSIAAGDGKLWSGGKAICTWAEACRLIGPMALEQTGESPVNDGLTDKLVGGCQMADVSVDTETGIIKINKIVSVQDIGTVINPLTANSQVYGGLIMGIAYAVSEERIMDNPTGRYINADLDNYKLPRIGDIGELVSEFYEPDSEYNRGVVGLGEPPVISTGAAISNAVANAIGVRVPVLPMTPKRVLEALKKKA